MVMRNLLRGQEDPQRGASVAILRAHPPRTRRFLHPQPNPHQQHRTGILPPHPQPRPLPPGRIKQRPLPLRPALPLLDGVPRPPGQLQRLLPPRTRRAREEGEEGGEEGWWWWWRSGGEGVRRMGMVWVGLATAFAAMELGGVSCLDCWQNFGLWMTDSAGPLTTRRGSRVEWFSFQFEVCAASLLRFLGLDAMMTWLHSWVLYIRSCTTG
ncbi:hypothetical protein EJ03DRAFT_376675 [Teratosphaeria nubilosa]|uniref:Uncharacterized protein n=1 Tax=Teratosphaeria nubilosa TaxID=161662 RepID=A0A6G1L1Y5_9PEZI|nr:hypothetical protein EJ03DRAFT_376675 [Teratosphaeria nubilosa]